MFIKAQPIFPKGLSREMNITAVFKCVLPASSVPTVLYIAAATRYKAYLCDKLINVGPAKAAHGHARVDELPIDLSCGGELRIDVASYNCHSFDGVCQPGFLVAEVRQGDNVLAATGSDFDAYINASRLQKVMRFSYQRHFSEVYNGIDDLKPIAYETVKNDVKYISRDMPLPCLDIIRVPTIAAAGACAAGEFRPLKNRFVEDTPHNSDGFAHEDFEDAPYDEYRSLNFTCEDSAARPWAAIELTAGKYVLADFGRVHTGFIRARLDVIQPARLMIAYEDYCPDGYVPCKRLEGQYIHMVTYNLPVGSYSLESFDPCEFRYLQFTLTKGSIRLIDAGMRTFMHPECDAALNSGDAKLDEIYQAAVDTYRQNALDVYMDCPTRERAGWLCDSYYSAQSEYEFTGASRIEGAFLHNFVQAGHLSGLPKGMLPMCYPADVLNGEFIPQWAMWYVVELRDYFLKRGASDDREYYRTLCYDMLAFFAGYENSDGLLENLPSWNFVEWSACNEWTKDVNYPTNFLYSSVLEAVGELYDDPALIKKSADLRENTARLAFDGEFFVDNAKRTAAGELINTENLSETCQYYALKFGRIDIDAPQYAALKHAVYDVFGSDYTAYAALGRQIVHSEAFMGMYLRMELLLERGLYAKLIDEVNAFFGNMAYLTGTLWEHKDVNGGSLNHGFASCVAPAIKRALNGLKK